jgi:ribosomal protein L44E
VALSGTKIKFVYLFKIALVWKSGGLMVNERKHREREIKKGKRLAERNQAYLLGHDDEGFPLVKARLNKTNTGLELTFLCPFCGRKHIHAGGPGNRIAHCYPPELAPIRGYVLVVEDAHLQPERIVC